MSMSKEELEAENNRFALAAVGIVDGRHPGDTDILVTLEGAIAVVLLYVTKGDARKASLFLNEGLAPRVEERMANSIARRESET